MSHQKGNLSYDNDERRKSGRVRTALTTCQHGLVLNLSKDGCRVVCKKAFLLPPGATTNLEIKSACMTVTAPARPVSCKPRPDGKFEIGFQFVGLSDELQRSLVQLARTAVDFSEAKPGKVG